MLMYDYFFDQWGTFEINDNPVLLSFTTSWLKLTGVQGFQRAYFFYLLANFLSPNKLSINLAYDYNSSPSQSVLISPNLLSLPYGEDPYYGQGTPYGGSIPLEQYRVFLNQQKCQAFQISVQELFDYSSDTFPGQGLSISGLNIVIGTKKGYPSLPSAQSVG